MNVRRHVASASASRCSAALIKSARHGARSFLLHAHAQVPPQSGGDGDFTFAYHARSCEGICPSTDAYSYSCQDEDPLDHATFFS